MRHRSSRLLRAFNSPSYVVFFVTSQCNANCKMCFYKETMSNRGPDVKELTTEEFALIAENMRPFNVLGISGGEPFLRDDLADIVEPLHRNCSPIVLDLPTNGFYTASVLKQTETIARHCEDMVVDLQISIDGPEKIHDEIRSLAGSFKAAKETYNGLVALRKRCKNLKIKICTVYSRYNQEYTKEILKVLKKDFRDADRIVFSVVHGSVSDPQAYDIDWNRYFNACSDLRNSAAVNDVLDFYSVFTMALKATKDRSLKDVLRRGDMRRTCGAGKRVVIVNEIGDLFPCEPLWKAVGNLRENHYDFDGLLNSKNMKEFVQEARTKKCACHWGLALSNSLLYRPRYYPKILCEIGAVTIRSLSAKINHFLT